MKSSAELLVVRSIDRPIRLLEGIADFNEIESNEKLKSASKTSFVPNLNSQLVILTSLWSLN